MVYTDGKKDILPTNPVLPEKLTPVLSEAPSKTKVVLFISNIAYTVTRNDLEGLFKPFGEKNGFRVRLAGPLNNPDFHSNRGIGWVIFKSKDDAEEAIKHTNNLDLQGRKLHVKWNRNKD